MKYFVSAFLMLAVLAVLCYGCAWYISAQVDQTGAHLSLAADAWKAGQQAQAEQYLELAAEHWSSKLPGFGMVLQHDCVDEVSREFERLRACAYSSDEEEFLQCTMSLLALLQNIRDLQWPSLRNIL